jgi:hypothetical protein
MTASAEAHLAVGTPILQSILRNNEHHHQIIATSQQQASKQLLIADTLSPRIASLERRDSALRRWLSSGVQTSLAYPVAGSWYRVAQANSTPHEHSNDASASVIDLIHLPQPAHALWDSQTSTAASYGTFSACQRFWCLWFAKPTNPLCLPTCSQTGWHQIQPQCLPTDCKAKRSVGTVPRRYQSPTSAQPRLPLHFTE